MSDQHVDAGCWLATGNVASVLRAGECHCQAPGGVELGACVREMSLVTEGGLGCLRMLSSLDK